ncbi:MAG TPA: carboxypeptidase-like regulatory domain-containing protein [Vicinamibacterales bacterium]|jgi:hypothetical protein|nr:carboxypeptidase-like regulatory domain-containing protein [Vicinamibacterales bacterium]
MLFTLLVVLATAPVSGRVVDAESHNPIAGAHVMLIPERNATVTAPGSLETITDQNGRFVFDAVEPGRYLVNANKAGFAPITDPLDMPALEIVEGRAFTGVEVPLMKGAAMTGRIVDAGGEPVSGLMVSALKLGDAGTAVAGMGITAQMAQTNDLGEFRLAGLPAGRYAIIAVPGPPGPFGQTTSAANGMVLVPTYYPGTTNKDAAEVIAAAGAQTVSGLQFSMISMPAYQVSGVVVDEAGTPLSGTMVLLMADVREGGTGAPAMGHSETNGTFRIGGVTPGTYRLMASMPVTWSARDGSIVGAGGGGAGFVAVTGGVYVGGAGVGGPGVPPPSQAAMQTPIEVTVDNGDVTGLKIVLTQRR